MKQNFIRLLLATSLLTASNAYANTQHSIEVISGLTECVGQLEAANDHPDTIDGVSTARISTRNALIYLLGGESIPASYRALIDEANEAFQARLLRSPMQARETIKNTRKSCMELVYAAEEARVASTKLEEQRKKEEQQAAMEMQRKLAEAEQAKRLEEQRRMELEIVKLREETKREENRHRLAINSKHLDTSLEMRKLDSADKKEDNTTNVKLAEISNEGMKIQNTGAAELARIENETARHVSNNETQVAHERIKADVAIDSKRTEASVAIAGHAVNALTAHGQQETERARINADAAVKIHNKQSEANVAIAGHAANAVTAHTHQETERARINANAAVAINSKQAEANVAIAGQAANAVRSIASEQTEQVKAVANAAVTINQNQLDQSHVASIASAGKDLSAKVETALECGAFYRFMAGHSKGGAKAKVITLSDKSFKYAKRNGADNDMVRKASRDLVKRFDSYGDDRSLIQLNARSLNERCSQQDFGA